MKTIFTFLCLLLSGVWAGATVQNSVSQDKSTRFYLKSYSLGGGGGSSYNYNYTWITPPWNSGAGDTNTATQSETTTFNYNLNWSDGVAGAGDWMDQAVSMNSIWGNPPPLFDNVNWTWPAGNWPNTSTNQLGSMIEASDWEEEINSNGVGVDVANDTWSTSQQNPPVQEEYCQVNLAPTYYFENDDFYGRHQVPVSTTFSRTAQTVMKLQVGGKSMAESKNLFKINVSATQLSPPAVYYSGIAGYGYMSQANNVSNVPPQIITIGNGTLNAQGICYVSVSGGDDLDVTPYVAGVNYYSFNETMTPVQTKADWQAVVRNEIYADTGGAADMNTYNPANGFMTNRPNLQAVYAFYQKLFNENGNLYWAGLGKLAGAPVYAGLSDAQFFIQGEILVGSDTNTFTTFQNTLITMNASILQDLAWQSEAYYKCGLNALATAYSFDTNVVDINTWQMIDQGVQQNNPGVIQAGNLLLAHREQLQVLQPIYNTLNVLGGITNVMSILAKNPVPTGTNFSTVIPNGNLCAFPDRWNWITNSTGGIWPAWTAASPTDRSTWVNIPLTTRANNYAVFPPVY